jgi:Fe-S-cluster-containing hydrogenase component 2
MKCDQCQEDDGDPICVKMCYPKAIQFVPVTHALYSKRITGALELRELASGAGYKAKEME